MHYHDNMFRDPADMGKVTPEDFLGAAPGRPPPPVDLLRVLMVPNIAPHACARAGAQPGRAPLFCLTCRDPPLPPLPCAVR